MARLEMRTTGATGQTSGGRQEKRQPTGTASCHFSKGRQDTWSRATSPPITGIRKNCVNACLWSLPAVTMSAPSMTLRTTPPASLCANCGFGWSTVPSSLRNRTSRVSPARITRCEGIALTRALPSAETTSVAFSISPLGPNKRICTRPVCRPTARRSRLSRMTISVSVPARGPAVGPIQGTSPASAVRSIVYSLEIIAA